MVGRRINKLRKQRNLRIDDLAIRIGVSSTELATVEHSGTGRLELLHSLATAFEVDVVAFFMEPEIFAGYLNALTSKLTSGEKSGRFLGLAIRDMLSEICKQLSGDNEYEP